jgi:hypothetical protein
MYNSQQRATNNCQYRNVGIKKKTLNHWNLHMPRQPVQTYNHKIHFNTNYVPVSKLHCFNKMYIQNSGYISTFNNSLYCKISDSHGGEYEDVFKDVVSCSPVDLQKCSYCLNHYRPDDGGDKHFRNVGILLPDYTTQHPRMTFTFILVAVRT